MLSCIKRTSAMISWQKVPFFQEPRESRIVQHTQLNFAVKAILLKNHNCEIRCTAQEGLSRKGGIVVVSRQRNNLFLVA